jgi:HSP20 family protein
MPEVDVKRQSSQSPGQASERSQQQTELARRGPDRSLFSLSPAEFLTRSPFSIMRRFSEEMDRMFEEFGGWRGSETATWSPAIEVAKHDNAFEVLAELPGLNESDIKVRVTDEGLEIQGERKREHEERRQGYHRSERSYGRFYRLIPLPEGANADQARAEFRNGELRVTIPVSERLKRGRDIPITTGDRKQAASQTEAKQQAMKAG